MFVDASAIVAILTREPDADILASVLDGARSPITSPIAIFEAALGVCRKRHASVAEAQEHVIELLGIANVRTVPITSKEAEAALDAFARYGKGRGHVAAVQGGRFRQHRHPPGDGAASPVALALRRRVRFRSCMTAG